MGEFDETEVEKRKKEILEGKDINIKRMSRHSMADVVSQFSETTRQEMTPASAAKAFSQPRLFTSLVDLDLFSGGIIGTRTEILGEPNTGKSLLAYVLGGACRRTCRRCFTPIVKWIDDYSVLKQNPKKWESDPNSLEFESKTSCLCGANDPMTVLFIDTEDQFDPYWASIWGLDVGNFDDYDAIDADNARGGNSVWSGVKISPDASVVVCRPTSSKTLEDVILPMVRQGAADVVILDSIASFAIEEDLAGTERVASRARFMRRFLTLLLAAQISANKEHGARPTLIATNHYMQGPVANPRMNPNKPTGGKAVGYTMDQVIELSSSKTNVALGDEGWKEGAVTRDVTFKITKARQGTRTNQTGTFRVYLDDHKLNEKISFTAGETDDPEKLLEYVKSCEDPDVWLVEQTKSGAIKAYWLLGRPFKKVKDIVKFLKRDDIRFMLRFILFARFLPVSGKMHLRATYFGYSPYIDDPAVKTIKKYDDKLGENLRRARTTVARAPQTKPAAREEEVGKELDFLSEG